MVTLTINDAAVLERLRQYPEKLADLSVPMSAFGLYMIRQTQLERFDKQQDPWGKAWKPLSPGRMAQKRIKKILTETSTLRDTIFHQPGRHEVAIVAPAQYAAPMQFGAVIPPHIISQKNKKALFWHGARHPVKQIAFPGATIPPRVFLGVNKDDEAELSAGIIQWVMS